MMSLRILSATLVSTALLLSAGCTSLNTAQSLQPNSAEQRISSLAALSKQDPVTRTLDIQEWHTSSGTKVLFMAAPELPMFDLRLTFAAGSSKDQQTYGLAGLTNAMLNEGTGSLDAGQIAARFEDLGADFSTGSYRDMAVVTLRSLSDPKLSTPALELFSTVAAQPSFPADSLTRIKNQLLAGFEYEKQNPGKLASLALFEQLYGEHPYAHSSAGNAQSVPAITRQQLQDFHRNYYTAKNAQIALVGDLTLAQAKAISETVSKRLPRGTAAAMTAEPTASGASKTHIEFPSTQTHILLAQLAVQRGDPDYPALFLGNQILGGGGFGTRLMEEVREKRGLTYGIYSSFSPMQATGPFMINVQTRAQLSEVTLQLVQDLLREYIANGPTEAELADAKRENLGSFPLSAASNSALVGQLAAIGFYDMPLTWMSDFMLDLQQLSVNDVHEAFKRHLNPDQLVIVTAGPTVEQLPLPEPVERSAQDAPVERQH
ncbi:MAG TPA: insulinase family protein [Gammaproteobacteria bacterium]|nr:insulinase family protein [Gammaproteobacteria bacterium]